MENFWVALAFDGNGGAQGLLENLGLEGQSKLEKGVNSAFHEHKIYKKNKVTCAFNDLPLSNNEK